MGKIKQGILGGFNGTVGTVVGGSWKGIAYMRGKAQSIKNPKTSAQMAQRAFFTEIMSLANQLTNDQIKTFFPNSVKGLSRRNQLARQLAEACTVTDGAKAFDASLLNTLGNASRTYNFGEITTAKGMGFNQSTHQSVVQSLLVNFSNNQGAVLDNYGALIVFNLTKGTIHCFNTTMKMNESVTIPYLDTWARNDEFKVIPFIYDSQLPVTGFGSFIIKTRPPKKGRPSQQQSNS